MMLMKLEIEDLEKIKVQKQQRDLFEGSPAEDLAYLTEYEAYVLKHDVDGIVACFGLLDIWQDRAMVWSILSTTSDAHMISIHKNLLKLLSCTPHKRIEMYVDCDFKEAHRWAKMLGFKKEAARMKSYYPDGRDSALYARVK